LHGVYGPLGAVASLPTTILGPTEIGNSTVLESYDASKPELDPIAGVSRAKLYVDNDSTAPSVDATDVSKTHVTYNATSHELTLSIVATGLTVGVPYRIEVYSKRVGTTYTRKLIYFSLQGAGELKQVQVTQESAPIEMITVPQAKPQVEASIVASLPTTLAPPTVVLVDEDEKKSSS
jgi:hypothetical protein